MEELIELLHRSYDEKLEPDAQKRLDKALSELPELMEEKENIERARNMLSSFEGSFDTGFAERVMESVKEIKGNLENGLYRLFTRVALSGVAAIVILLLSVYFIDGAISVDTILGIDEYTAEEAMFTYLSQ